MRRTQLVHRNAGIPRGLLEGADLLDGTLAELTWVRLAVGVAQPAEQLEQRCGGLDEGIEAEADFLRAFGRNWRGGGARLWRWRSAALEGRWLRWLLRRWRGTAAAGRWADDRTVGIVGFGERIVAHRYTLPNSPPPRGRGSLAPPLPRSGGGLGRGCLIL